MISKEQVEKVQKKWAEGLIKIGQLRDNRTLCEKEANEFLDRLYAFGHGTVLFKPTKCFEVQFRNTKEKGLCYFIAGKDCICREDRGFATTPWVHVRFENSGMILEDNRAIAMGNYFFTGLDGDEVKVEYTFGYRKINGELKIDVHHSSLPYHP